MTLNVHNIWGITLEQAKSQLKEIRDDLDDPSLIGMITIEIKSNPSSTDVSAYVVNPKNDDRLNNVNLLGILELTKAMVLNGDFDTD